MEQLRRAKDPEANAELAAKYLALMERLPSIQQVSEESIPHIIPRNLETVFDLMKIYLSLLSEIKVEMGESFPLVEIDKFFTSVVKPNLVQLYSETPTVFYKCLQIGDSNLKNKFFEICLQMCKMDAKYLFEVLEYLSSVYQKGDFSNGDTLMVDIRKEEHIGLKNLGCTCYANSMFQQLYHNLEIQKALMSYNPDPSDQDQLVLYHVSKLFWKLKHTKMSHTFLDEFCRVFTSFDGMPINVRV